MYSYAKWFNYYNSLAIYGLVKKWIQILHRENDTECLTKLFGFKISNEPTQR